jgi:hypothetical protein
MNNWFICLFFTHILLGILIFKGLTARRFYMSFGVKGLIGNKQGLRTGLGCFARQKDFLSLPGTESRFLEFPARDIVSLPTELNL